MEQGRRVDLRTGTPAEAHFSWATSIEYSTSSLSSAGRRFYSSTRQSAPHFLPTGVKITLMCRFFSSNIATFSLNFLSENVRIRNQRSLSVVMKSHLKFRVKTLSKSVKFWEERNKLTDDCDANNNTCWSVVAFLRNKRLIFQRSDGGVHPESVLALFDVWPLKFVGMIRLKEEVNLSLLCLSFWRMFYSCLASCKMRWWWTTCWFYFVKSRKNFALSTRRRLSTMWVYWEGVGCEFAAISIVNKAYLHVWLVDKLKWIGEY